MRKNTVTIRIGGKKRTFKYNMNSDAIMCEGMDISVSELTESLKTGRIARLYIWAFYAGLHNNYEATGDMEGLDEIDYHKVADWLDDVTDEDKAKVFECYIRCRVRPKSSEEEPEEETDPKKK